MVITRFFEELVLGNAISFIRIPISEEVRKEVRKQQLLEYARFVKEFAKEAGVKPEVVLKLDWESRKR